MEKDTLYKFFDGIASSTEKEAIRSWLEASPEHEAELFKEREFFDAMILSGHMETTAAPRKENRYPFYQKMIREVIKIAAVFVLTAGCGLYLYRAEMKEIEQALNTISVPPGQRVNLTLPDGTNVWLNARSEMKYPAAFAGSKREVTLNGEAYFEVAHHAQKPFIVRTEKCEIEVLGTKFNVEAYADSDDFNTALMEGSVKVTDSKHAENTIRLSPNYQASFVNGALSASPIRDFDSFRWKEGLVCFKNIDFEALMHRFEKCYGIRIVVENKALSTYICSGKFRIADGVDNALRLLQKDAKYQFERNKDESVIYIK